MKFRITSPFGSLEEIRTHPHTGIDFAMKEGTPLRSIEEGIIQKVVDYGDHNLGKGVFIQWQDGKVAIYGHMKEIVVHPGEIIHKGDLLGYSGSTGYSTGPHLHFGLKDEMGHFVDPSFCIHAIQHMNDEVPIKDPESLLSIQEMMQSIWQSWNQYMDVKEEQEAFEVISDTFLF